MSAVKSLYATMRALPGCHAEVSALLTGLAEKVRAEPGCLRFVVYALENDPALFHVEETYRDEAAFESHMGTAHGKKINEALAPLVEGGASKVVFLTFVA